MGSKPEYIELIPEISNRKNQHDLLAVEMKAKKTSRIFLLLKK